MMEKTTKEKLLGSVDAPLSSLMNYILKHPKFIDFYCFSKENKIEIYYGKEYKYCNLNKLIDSLSLSFKDNFSLLLLSFENREYQEKNILSMVNDVLKTFTYNECEIMMRFFCSARHLDSNIENRFKYRMTDDVEICKWLDEHIEETIQVNLIHEKLGK